MAQKRFQIIAITDERTVLINAGKNDGITSGASFDILSSKPTKLKDPDTGEVLAEFPQKKQRIYVQKVFDKYCICVSKYTTQSVNALAEELTLNHKLGSTIYDIYTKKETVGKDLNVDKKDFSTILKDYSYARVRVGDSVQLVK